jgi:hypothetical protein
MRSAFAEAQPRTNGLPVAESGLRQATAPSGKEIPYDYVARFLLSGTRGTRHQDVINISIEGAFIATAIAYGFVAKRSPLPSTLIKGPGGQGGLRAVARLAAGSQVTLIDVIADAVGAALQALTNADRDDIAQHAKSTLVPCLLSRLCGIEFKYAIVDSGTGRELQNIPIYNIAGLGRADGDRPFRPFPKPMTFQPRSTIRIEVEELSEGPLYKDGELQIALHGYKALG